MRNLLIVFLLFVGLTCVNAQDISVKKFEPMTKDQTAALSPRKDINGVTCGLVKVQLKEPGAEFEGRILGDVEQHDGEYWIYLAKGTKFLTVRHSDYLPTTIVFSNYGIKGITSGATYHLALKAEKTERKTDSKRKGIVAFQLNPYDAELSVDGENVVSSGGGAYSMMLPYGTHFYSIRYKDFTLSNQMVKIDKQPKSVDIDLTEFFSQLTIVCKTNDAAIYVNDELQGLGNWSGQLTPGEYVIRVSKEGFNEQSRTIVLQENDEQKIQIGELKRIAGELYVDFAPKGANVYLDGKKIGTSPIRADNISPGLHQLKIEMSNCAPEERPVVISEGKVTKIEGELKMPLWDLILTRAEKGDGCAMVMIGDVYEGEFIPCEDFVKKNKDKIKMDGNEKVIGLVKEKNYEKAMDWYRKATTQQKNICTSCKATAMEELAEFDKMYKKKR